MISIAKKGVTIDLSWQNGRKPLAPNIRPYASLRVPSLRHLSGPARPTICFANLHLASSAIAEGCLRTRPLQAPPLGRLKSQLAASELTRMKSKSSGSLGRLSKSDPNLEDPSLRAPPVTCDFRRPSGGVRKGRGRSPLRRSRRARVVDLAKQVVGRVAPGGHWSEGTRSAA